MPARRDPGTYTAPATRRGRRAIRAAEAAVQTGQAAAGVAESIATGSAAAQTVAEYGETGNAAPLRAVAQDIRAERREARAQRRQEKVVEKYVTAREKLRVQQRAVDEKGNLKRSPEEIADDLHTSVDRIKRDTRRLMKQPGIADRNAKGKVVGFKGVLRLDRHLRETQALTSPRQDPQTEHATSMDPERFVEYLKDEAGPTISDAYGRATGLDEYIQKAQAQGTMGKYPSTLEFGLMLAGGVPVGGGAGLAIGSAIKGAARAVGLGAKGAGTARWLSGAGSVASKAVPQAVRQSPALRSAAAGAAVSVPRPIAESAAWWAEKPIRRTLFAGVPGSAATVGAVKDPEQFAAGLAGSLKAVGTANWGEALHDVVEAGKLTPSVLYHTAKNMILDPEVREASLKSIPGLAIETIEFPLLAAREAANKGPIQALEEMAKGFVENAELRWGPAAGRVPWDADILQYTGLTQPEWDGLESWEQFTALQESPQLGGALITLTEAAGIGAIGSRGLMKAGDLATNPTRVPMEEQNAVQGFFGGQRRDLRLSDFGEDMVVPQPASKGLFGRLGQEGLDIARDLRQSQRERKTGKPKRTGERDEVHPRPETNPGKEEVTNLIPALRHRQENRRAGRARDEEQLIGGLETEQNLGRGYRRSLPDILKGKPKGSSRGLSHFRNRLPEDEFSLSALMAERGVRSKAETAKAIESRKGMIEKDYNAKLSSARQNAISAAKHEQALRRKGQDTSKAHERAEKAKQDYENLRNTPPAELELLARIEDGIRSGKINPEKRDIAQAADRFYQAGDLSGKTSPFFDAETVGEGGLTATQLGPYSKLAETLAREGKLPDLDETLGERATVAAERKVARVKRKADVAKAQRDKIVRDSERMGKEEIRVADARRKRAATERNRAERAVGRAKTAKQKKAAEVRLRRAKKRQALAEKLYQQANRTAAQRRARYLKAADRAVKAGEKGVRRAEAQRDRFVSRETERQRDLGIDQPSVFERTWSADRGEYTRRVGKEKLDAQTERAPAYIRDIPESGGHSPWAHERTQGLSGQAPKSSTGSLFRSGRRDVSPDAVLDGLLRNAATTEKARVLFRIADRMGMDAREFLVGEGVRVPDRQLTRADVTEMVAQINKTLDALPPNVTVRNVGRLFEKLRKNIVGKDLPPSKVHEELVNMLNKEAPDKYQPLEELKAHLNDIEQNPELWADLEGWRIMDYNVAQEIAPQLPNNPTQRAIKQGFIKSKSLASKLLLGLNPQWLGFQVYGNMALLGVAQPTAFFGSQFTHWMDRAKLDDAAKRNWEQTVGVSPHMIDYGSMGGNTLMGWTVQMLGMKNSGVYRRVKGRSILDPMFRLDYKNNHMFKSMFLHNKVKREAWRRMDQRMNGIMSIWDRGIGKHMPKGKARKEDYQAAFEAVVKDKKTMEKFGKEMDSFMGDYLSFSSAERNLLANNVMFYGFLRHSLTLALLTLPKHPIRAAILTKMGQAAIEDKREILRRMMREAIKDFIRTQPGGRGVDQETLQDWVGHYTRQYVDPKLDFLPITTLGDFYFKGPVELGPLTYGDEGWNRVGVSRAAALGNLLIEGGLFEEGKLWRIATVINPFLALGGEILTGMDFYTGAPLRTGGESSGSYGFNTLPAKEAAEAALQGAFELAPPLRGLLRGMQEIPSSKKSVGSVLFGEEPTKYQQQFLKKAARVATRRWGNITGSPLEEMLRTTAPFAPQRVDPMSALFGAIGSDDLATIGSEIRGAIDDPFAKANPWTKEKSEDAFADSDAFENSPRGGKAANLPDRSTGNGNIAKNARMGKPDTSKRPPASPEQKKANRQKANQARNAPVTTNRNRKAQKQARKVVNRLASLSADPDAKQEIVSALRYGPQYGIQPSVLVSQLEIETPSSDKLGPPTPYGPAKGNAQFIQGTRDQILRDYGVDAYASVDDAVHAQALLLKQEGYSEDPRAAIFAYNHSTDYVNDVLNGSQAYAELDHIGSMKPAQDQPHTVSPVRFKNPDIIGRPHQGTHTLGNWQSDNAIDISVPEGTKIQAARSGIVDKVSGSNDDSSSQFNGFQVTIGGDTFYTHLSSVDVKPGDKVKAGQVIGLSGSANGVPHLHFGVEEGENPMDVMNGTAPGVEPAPPKAPKPAKMKQWVKTVESPQEVGSELGVPADRAYATSIGKLNPALQTVLYEIGKRSGQPVNIQEGFRTRERQETLYADRANNPYPVAAPGTSNHEGGNAVDMELTDAQAKIAAELGLTQPVANDPVHWELVDTPDIATSTAYPSVGGSAVSGSSTSSSGGLFGGTPVPTKKAPQKKKQRGPSKLEMLELVNQRRQPGGMDALLGLPSGGSGETMGESAPLETALAAIGSAENLRSRTLRRR